MTRFVAALLVAAGPAVKAQLDPRIPGAGDLGPSRSAALLIRAHREGRAQRAEGVAAMERLGREAWNARQQRGGTS
jgi:hypothetical protein